MNILHRWTPLRDTPPLRDPGPWDTSGALPSSDRPKFYAFFPSPATIFILSSLFWGSSRGILVVFEGRDPEMCTLGVVGLSCEAPAAAPLLTGSRDTSGARLDFSKASSEDCANGGLGPLMI